MRSSILFLINCWLCEYTGAQAICTVYVCVLLGWGRCSPGWYIQGRNSSLFYVTSFPVRLIKGHRLIRILCQLCYWIHSKLLWGDTVRKDIETFSMLLYYSFYYKQKIFWHKFEGCCPLPPPPGPPAVMSDISIIWCLMI